MRPELTSRGTAPSSGGKGCSNFWVPNDPRNTEGVAGWIRTFLGSLNFEEMLRLLFVAPFRIGRGVMVGHFHLLGIPSFFLLCVCVCSTLASSCELQVKYSLYQTMEKKTPASTSSHPCSRHLYCLSSKSLNSAVFS